MDWVLIGQVCLTDLVSATVIRPRIWPLYWAGLIPRSGPTPHIDSPSAHYRLFVSMPWSGPEYETFFQNPIYIIPFFLICKCIVNWKGLAARLRFIGVWLNPNCAPHLNPIGSASPMQAVFQQSNTPHTYLERRPHALYVLRGDSVRPYSLCLSFYVTHFSFPVRPIGQGFRLLYVCILAWCLLHWFCTNRYLTCAW